VRITQSCSLATTKDEKADDDNIVLPLQPVLQRIHHTIIHSVQFTSPQSIYIHIYTYTMTRSTTTTLCVAATILGSAASFAFVPSISSSTKTSTQLQMGLFDGVKDAFSAPALERSTLNSERETPIDRWMGWSVSKENEQQAPKGT
jgi:hypothetical protein